MNPIDFRTGMRQLASGVAIITTAVDGKPFGLTATAVTSLSDTPPALIACVNRNASAHDRILESRRFCVNILSEEQQALARRFSGAVPPERRFDEIEYVLSAHGVRFEESLVCFSCVLGKSEEYGTHSILIGSVEDVVQAEERPPLIYLRGSFGSVQTA